MAVEAVGAVSGLQSSIRPLWDEMPLTAAITRRRTASGTGDVSFSDVFENTLQSALGESSPVTDLFRTVDQSVRETDAERVRMEYLMATGQLDNPALLTIASSRAQISLNLMIQLRNRAVEAYNELMRISL